MSVSATGSAIDRAELEKIEDFMADYGHAIDDGRLDDWPDFFTEDGFYQVISRESFAAGHPIGVLSCEGRAMMQDRAQAMQKANIYEPHHYCHLLSRARVQRSEPGLYAARTNFTVIRTMQDGGSEIFASGHYRDVIAIVDGAPKFKERRAILDSRRIDILLVLPL